MERPKCSIEGCNNGGHMIIGGRLYCGECYNKWEGDVKNKFREEIEQASRGN